MESDPAVLSARGLSIGRGGRTLASGIELELMPGEIVAVLGPNGVGKSTLLATLAGLIEPLAGSVQSRSRVALALQSAPLARRNVLANVELALSWWGVRKPDRRRRALAALELLGAAQLADRSARRLSGGEARRVHLARVLALEPGVLMLDEPFAGLDVTIRSSLLTDLAAALRAHDTATLVVLHERAEAWALADRLLILIGGRLAAAGTPAEILERPPTIEVAQFLGFAGELRQRDGKVVRLRPAHVAVDPAGDRVGKVVRRIPEEDAVRCELECAEGNVQAMVDYPGPALGENVKFRLTGGAWFDEKGDPSGAISL